MQWPSAGVKTYIRHNDAVNWLSVTRDAATRLEGTEPGRPVVKRFSKIALQILFCACVTGAITTPASAQITFGIGIGPGYVAPYYPPYDPYWGYYGYYGPAYYGYWPGYGGYYRGYYGRSGYYGGYYGHRGYYRGGYGHGGYHRGYHGGGGFHGGGRHR